MLESLGVEPIADWVLHHHERWDGDGYPDRLRGEEIPLGARIIFVADAYDAMTSERVYDRSRSPSEALEELERCSGSQFDPAIVDAFSEELGVRSRVVELAS
jgi:diguanylate cyclase